MTEERQEEQSPEEPLGEEASRVMAGDIEQAADAPLGTGPEGQVEEVAGGTEGAQDTETKPAATAAEEEAPSGMESPHEAEGEARPNLGEVPGQLRQRAMPAAVGAAAALLALLLIVLRRRRS
jgi:hypothetical protein